MREVHCPPELLDDLADVLARVRAWAGVAEKSPGVFHARRQPFLHFHLTAERRRRADVKSRSGWLPVELPRPITASARRALLAVLRRCHEERMPGAAPRRPRAIPSGRSARSRA
ncbi:MAG: hypothetical protein FJZ38_10095 [Candidatus Rokubacteria bacterium]|nr:hypothetical protein [Candidatus Rokubacteria bacterium]